MSPALIMAAIEAGIQLITLATKAAEEMKQSRELDPVNEAALDAKIKSLQENPWWKPTPAFRGDAVI